MQNIVWETFIYKSEKCSLLTCFYHFNLYAYGFPRRFLLDIDQVIMIDKLCK